MTVSIAFSRAGIGLEAPLVTVEAHISAGLPAFAIVGLPEAEVREARDRVRSALLNSGFEFPARRMTVNLAPADLPKGGGRFDLPIALAILAATGQIAPAALSRLEFAGELALTGALRPFRGALATVWAAHRDGRPFILPTANAEEAALVRDATIYAADSLGAVCAHLLEREPLPRRTGQGRGETPAYPDLAEVKGQILPRRALEVAAAGGHSILFYGPPGTGKSMLAQRLPGILPTMSEDEALETAAIHSVSSQGFRLESWGQRPWRGPHHSASAVALVGGGSDPRPGEISLAHNGVLFLDETPEFDRKVLEALREPLESGRITISRAAHQAEFPARFQLVAAMNPCPCGYLGHPSGRCRCTPDQVSRYRGRLSGPFLDRIDLQVEVPSLKEDEISVGGPAGEASVEVGKRVAKARERALRRQGKANAALQPVDIDRHCAPSADADRLLRQAIRQFGLSARAYHRLLKVARTIADLAGAQGVAAPHVAEAIQYRRFERD